MNKVGKFPASKKHTQQLSQVISKQISIMRGSNIKKNRESTKITVRRQEKDEIVRIGQPKWVNLNRDLNELRGVVSHWENVLKP